MKDCDLSLHTLSLHGTKHQFAFMERHLLRWLMRCTLFFMNGRDQIWHKNMSSNQSSVLNCLWLYTHYIDYIMSKMVLQIIGASIICLTVCWGTYQRKHQSSASLAFVRRIQLWPVDFPHKGPVARKMFPFDDVIIWTLQIIVVFAWSHYSMEAVYATLTFCFGVQKTGLKELCGGDSILVSVCSSACLFVARFISSLLLPQY